MESKELERIDQILDKLNSIENKLDNRIVNEDKEGVQRTPDPLGRITIPKEYRRLLQIDENTLMDITIQNGMIIIKKVSE